jgi:hypothetical protein
MPTAEPHSTPCVVRCLFALFVALTTAGCGVGSTQQPTNTAALPAPASATTGPVVVTVAPPVSTTVPPGAAAVLAPTPAQLTSCQRVVHLGDSTSVGLISPNYIRDPAARLPAQYERVGVGSSRMEIDGARSIVETIPKQINAHDAAVRAKAAGFEGGCWVLALGTTDTANVAVGSRVSRSERIDRMMEVIGGDPVLWLSARTLVGRGAWSDANMKLWNQALLDATARYPNIRIFDWASVARDEWFSRDGIHYTSAGFAARASAIADALAVAYPAS